MSVSPESLFHYSVSFPFNEQPAHDDRELRTKGFIFSFKRYSRINPGIETLLQRAVEACVHGITQSDFIHVEVIPVVEAAFDVVQVYPFTFTAFAMQGFTCNLTENCMGGDFVHLYVPLTADDTAKGVEFLSQMQGWDYHYWAAIKAMFNKETENEHHEHHNRRRAKRVFCSEAALLMCKHVGIYQGDTRPSQCMPQHLFDLIARLPSARIVQNIEPVHGLN